jgi:hypothetical protein
MDIIKKPSICIKSWIKFNKTQNKSAWRFCLFYLLLQIHFIFYFLSNNVMFGFKLSIKSYICAHQKS